MKRSLKFVVALFSLVLSVSIAASATDVAASVSSTTVLADDLKEIGVLTGTDSGYELNRAPTRIEASVMLVRLLGEEENAAEAYESGTISHPFTDIPEWADAYIAYLFTNNLANGISTTEFGANDLCSAQMYCTYILRVLGYSDSNDEDFTFSGAIDFATSVGLVDSVLLSETFTRGSVVAISYQALATNVKAGDGDLLSKLIADGAIDAASAENISQKIATYNKINKASDKINRSFDGNMTLSMSMTVDGETATLSDMNYSIKENISDTSVEAEIIAVSVDPTTNEPISVSEWIKDGWIYVDDGTQKYKKYMDFSEILATVQNSSMTTDPTPIYYYTDITDDSENGETSYTVSIAPDYLNAAVESLLHSSFIDEQSFDLVYKQMTACYKFDQSGSLINIITLVDMDITYPESETISTSYNYNMKINTIGQTVEISFPDLTEFTEITE